MENNISTNNVNSIHARFGQISILLQKSAGTRRKTGSILQDWLLSPDYSSSKQ